MISAIRELALLELNRRFQRHETPLEQLRQEHGKEIAPFLSRSLSYNFPRLFVAEGSRAGQYGTHVGGRA